MCYHWRMLFLFTPIAKLLIDFCVFPLSHFTSDSKIYFLVLLHVWLLTRRVDEFLIPIFGSHEGAIISEENVSIVGQSNVVGAFMYYAQPIPSTSNDRACQHLPMKALFLQCMYFLLVTSFFSLWVVFVCTMGKNLGYCWGIVKIFQVFLW